MAVPSKEEFDEFIFLVDGIHAQELARLQAFNGEIFLQDDFLSHISDPSPLDILIGNLTIENIEGFFNKAYDIIEEKDMLRIKHPVQIWLNQHPSNPFGLATENMFTGKLKEMNRNQWVEFYKVEALSILDVNPLNNSVSYQLISQLEDLHRLVQSKLYYRAHKWLYTFTFNLQIYYYPTVIDLEDNAGFDEHLQSLLDYKKGALAASKYLIDYLNSNESKSVAIRDKKEGFEALEQLHSDLEVDIKERSIGSPIVKRGDKTKRERSLIYHLWQSLKTTESRGVTAILHLLSLEGVENQQDPRTIHRMIAKWEEQESTDDIERSTLAEQYPHTQFGELWKSSGGVDNGSDI